MNCLAETPQPVLPVTRLDQDVYQDMRWCVHCCGRRVFVDVYEFDWGCVAWCLGCGERHEVLFTRTTGEAA